jgi:hypothetical protein
LRASASRSAGTPGIGAYWLWPARIWRATSSTSSGAQSKSGKPCPMLMASSSTASCDITWKMLTPAEGSFD